MKINVIDSIMGSGKSQYAIQFMNESIDDNFIYITPYLDEVDRIKTSCNNRVFIEPKECEEAKIYSKSKSLKELMKSGSDIATTHSLFKIVDEEAEQILEASSYTLILDEVMDVVQQIPINRADLDLLFTKSEILKVDEYGMVILGKDAEEYINYGKGKFSKLIHMAKLKRLFMFENTIMLWEFPVDIFRYFKEVYILTYLFDGQVQKYFFDFYNVEYEKFSINKINNRYEMIPYSNDLDINRKLDIKKLVCIYDGKLNDIGKLENSLSVTWYEKSTGIIREMMGNNIYNYFKNINQSKSNDSLWTCYKEYRLEVKSFKRAFIPHNLRATNEYSKTHSLAYGVNRYISPYLIRYFKTKNINVNQDIYAVSEMVQWIWRSRIRNGESISIYIPSSRMRKLFIKWLNNELE